MKIIFDIERYKELLEKNEILLAQQSNSFFETEDELIELLSYYLYIQHQISYERREDYYFLIFRYIEKLITLQIFQSEFLKMEKTDARVAQLILNDFEQLAVFSVDLKALKFSPLTAKISEVCRLVTKLSPEEGIINQEFHKSLEKIYFEMRKFLKKDTNFS
jgi:hypothetical protein